MIARSWSGRCPDAESADRYARHLAETVLPGLAAIEGHAGALMLRREAGDSVEVRVVTFWASLEALDRFAGPERDRAVVEPAARAVLDEYAERVELFDVVIDRTG